MLQRADCEDNNWYQTGYQLGIRKLVNIGQNWCTIVLQMAIL